MTKEHALKLKELHENGYGINIISHYVDTLVYEIVEKEDDIVYSSSVYRDRSLLPISAYEVEVFEFIDDWENLTV